MEKFKIEIKETLSRIVEIEAKDKRQAALMVEKWYRDEKIVLDESDYVETDFRLDEGGNVE